VTGAFIADAAPKPSSRATDWPLFAKRRHVQKGRHWRSYAAPQIPAIAQPRAIWKSMLGKFLKLALEIANARANGSHFRVGWVLFG
jgi:hypothetical protein